MLILLLIKMPVFILTSKLIYVLILLRILNTDIDNLLNAHVYASININSSTYIKASTNMMTLKLILTFILLRIPIKILTIKTKEVIHTCIY